MKAAASEQSRTAGGEEWSKRKPCGGEREATKRSIKQMEKVDKVQSEEGDDCKGQKVEKESKASSVLVGTREDLLDFDRSKPCFSEQLYDILEMDEHRDVLQWMPDGKAFYIVDQKKFALRKMVVLFSIRNMSSFVRKLHRWGFNRIVSPGYANRDVFQHPDFHKGDRLRARKKVKCIGKLLALAAASSTANANKDFAKKTLRGEPDDSGVSQRAGRYLHPPTPGFPRTDVASLPNFGRVPEASGASSETFNLSHQQQDKDMELNERDLQVRALEIERQRRQLMLEQWQLREAARQLTSPPQDGVSSLPHQRGVTNPGLASGYLPRSSAGATWAPGQSSSFAAPSLSMERQELLQRQAHLLQGCIPHHLASSLYPSIATPPTAAILPLRMTLNPLEARSRQRKAVIRALLEEEEQELQMKRRAGVAIGPTHRMMAQRQQRIPMVSGRDATLIPGRGFQIQQAQGSAFQPNQAKQAESKTVEVADFMGASRDSKRH